MKFTDVYWRVKDGILLYQASGASDITHSENEITVYAPASQVGEGNRGLGGITLTYRFFLRRKM